MSSRKPLLLFLFALILGAGICVEFAQDNFEDNDDDQDDLEWPAGVSPLNSLSFWDDDDNEGAVGAGGANGCCLPRTWTGRLFTEVKREGGGRPQAKPRPRPRDRALRLMEVVYVDQVNKRVAEDVTIPRRRGNATKFSSIVLFKNGSATLYTFCKVAKRCVRKELKGAQFRPQCLPANATLRGSFSLGAGSGALKAQSWGFCYRDRRVAVASNVILAPGNCVPIIGGDKIVTRPRVGDDDNDDLDKKRRRPQVTTIGTLYTDVATTIPDPSVFTPPSYCSKAEDDGTLTFDPDADVTTIVERYVAVP